MHAPEVRRAVAAATSIAASLDLPTDEAVVLNNSNKLTLRLLPCDVVARVAPAKHQVAGFEIDLARRLVRAGGPVAAPEPRVEPLVHARDGFVVTLWTHHAATGGPLAAAEYADALRRLHAAMRTVDLPAPHFTDRVDDARRLLASRERTPSLRDSDRELLEATLRRAPATIAERAAAEQLLHGEPHPGNLLAAEQGPLFVDLETCCRGPVEFDLAHAPDEVAQHYPGVDDELLRTCRLLALTMITTWRWDPGDQLPNGRELGVQWLSQLRAALGRPGP